MNSIPKFTYQQIPDNQLQQPLADHNKHDYFSHIQSNKSNTSTKQNKLYDGFYNRNTSHGNVLAIINLIKTMCKAVKYDCTSILHQLEILDKETSLLCHTISINNKARLQKTLQEFINNKLIPTLKTLDNEIEEDNNKSLIINQSITTIKKYLPTL